jgi:hypothetical protein
MNSLERNDKKPQVPRTVWDRPGGLRGPFLCFCRQSSGKGGLKTPTFSEKRVFPLLGRLLGLKRVEKSRKKAVFFGFFRTHFSIKFAKNSFFPEFSGAMPDIAQLKMRVWPQEGFTKGP